MNKDVYKRESLTALLVKFNLSILGNESSWFIVTTDLQKFVDHPFNSISEMNIWSRRYLQKLEDEKLAKDGKTKPGGLQIGMFDD